jgi:hypothetical protein
MDNKINASEAFVIFVTALLVWVLIFKTVLVPDTANLAQVSQILNELPLR